MAKLPEWLTPAAVAAVERWRALVSADRARVGLLIGYAVGVDDVAAATALDVLGALVPTSPPPPPPASETGGTSGG